MSNCNRDFTSFIGDILEYGVEVTTRNSDVIRLGNHLISFNSTPLIGIRKTAWKTALRELEWFMSGSNDIKDLHSSVHPWWAPWANSEGLIANNYSCQLRGFNAVDSSGSLYGFDQVDFLIKGIRNHPYSRRNVITTWNPAEMQDSATPITNCHGTIIQAMVDPDNSLHLTMIQRSADVMLGVQHNWIQYWALLLYLAHKTGTKPGEFVWHGIDCHIYKNHLPMAKKAIDYNGKMPNTPELVYKPTSEQFVASDFSLDGDYEVTFDEKLPMTV